VGRDAWGAAAGTGRADAAGSSLTGELWEGSQSLARWSVAGEGARESARGGRGGLSVPKAGELPTRGGGTTATGGGRTGGGQIGPVCFRPTGTTGGAGGTGRGKGEVEDSDGGEDGRGGRPGEPAKAGLATVRTATGAGVTFALCTVMRSR
jgi:hypothetical protein